MMHSKGPAQRKLWEEAHAKSTGKDRPQTSVPTQDYPVIGDAGWSFGWLATLLLLLAARPGMDFVCTGSGAVLEAVEEPTDLQTGQGLPLQRLSLSFPVPTNLASVSLVFDVGFGTAEALTAGELYDSFSVILRNPDRTFSTSLLTADLFGITWAPVNPEGQGLTNQLMFEPASAPSFSRPYAQRFAYAVAVEIPALVFRGAGTLLLSLFDNLDAESSAGLVRDLSIGPSLSAPLALESSAAANGPFAEETGVRLNRIQRTITLPGGGSVRFYRLRGGSPNRISRLRMVGDGMYFDYEAAPVQVSLRLLTAGAESQPYHIVPEAIFDLTNKTVRVRSDLVGPFLQLSGNVVGTITGIQKVGSDQVLTFQYIEPVPILESSTQAQGPFAPEYGVVGDPVAKQLKLPRNGQARFFRLRSDTPLVIRRQERAGNDLIQHYDLP